jgi:quercetin dioxygenase-like cupin family protein
MIVTANQSVLIPAGARHGFKNVGTGILRVRATLAAAIFEASYDDRNELSRRYVPQDA